MISIKQISNLIDGTIIGDKNLKIAGPCDIEIGKKNCITYVKDNTYFKKIKKNKASAVIVNNDFKGKDLNKTFIKVNNSSYSFLQILKYFKDIQVSTKNDISKDSFISNDAKIADKVYIGPKVVIEKNVIIEKNVSIYPGTYIGEGTKIGSGTKILSNVTVYDNVLIGKECRIESGTIIGSEGFGIIQYKGKNYNIPHVGSVTIGNHVAIGSNCTIDRGTINDTKIGDNSKLDNLIQIGHNVIIGKNCMLSSQVGIAGSSELGDNVIVAGQSGIIDHIKIGKNSVIAVKSCVFKSVKSNSFISGIPATDHNLRLKQEAILNKLPQIYKIYKKIK